MTDVHHGAQAAQAERSIFFGILRAGSRASIGFAAKAQAAQAQTPLLLEKKEIHKEGGKEKEEKSQGGQILRCLRFWPKPSIHAGSGAQDSSEMPALILRSSCARGDKC